MTTLVEAYVPLSSDRGSTPLGSIWSISEDTLNGVFFRFSGCFGLYVAVNKLVMTRFLGFAVNGYSEFH
ncbi:hypothetical protein PaeBR_00930 [Paenibacillus sp. BR2-3]|uniref:hypothetical protein n=1 Tax=Paenibacillus sp. BR2-3 TaxID=3048494 RepID=UPI0039779F45